MRWPGADPILLPRDAERPPLAGLEAELAALGFR
jgi:hypothetical protein